MMGMHGLKLEARRSAEFRGHKLGQWQKLVVWNDTKRNTGIANAYCDICGKSVTVNIRPMPNQIEVGGEAVAIGCND